MAIVPRQHIRRHHIRSRVSFFPAPERYNKLWLCALFSLALKETVGLCFFLFVCFCSQTLSITRTRGSSAVRRKKQGGTRRPNPSARRLGLVIRRPLSETATTPTWGAKKKKKKGTKKNKNLPFSLRGTFSCTLNSFERPSPTFV